MPNSLVKDLIVPGSFSFVLVLLGVILIIFKKKRKGKYLAFIGLLIYYLFSITPVADFAIRNLESKFAPLNQELMDEANTIVVLSGGAKADVLRSSEVLRISTLKNHSSKLIISGTQEIADRDRTSLVETFFISRGIPAEMIYIEDESRNTRENAKQIAKQIGDEPFFLVTSGYHMKRAMIEFEKLKTNPIPAPTDFRAKKNHYGFNDYIPNSDNLRKSDLAIHEYLGILYYSLFD